MSVLREEKPKKVNPCHLGGIESERLAAEIKAMRCRRIAVRGDRLRPGCEATDADAARPTADGVGDVPARAVAPVADSVGLRASKISWEHFHTFVVFVRTGSLRRAGVEMNIDPSTVCRRVEALERRLGVSLLRREHHVLRITQAGRSALERAEHIAAEIADLERTLSGMDDQLAGKVRIGVPCELAACMIDSINEFEQANTAIDVEIRSITADTDLESLDIDCAVAVTDHPPGHLIGRLLGRLTAAAYASAAYLDQHDPAGAPEACAGIQLTSVGGRVCDPMKHLLPDVPVRTRCDDVGCVLHAVRAGMGIAALPCMLGDSEPLLARVGPRVSELAGVWLLAHPDTRTVVRIEAARNALAATLTRCVHPVAHNVLRIPNSVASVSGDVTAVGE